MKSFVWGFFTLFLCLQSVQAAKIIYADMDNTLVESRKEFSGTWQSRYILYRIDFRRNVAEPIAEGPKTVEVTAEEVRDIRSFLGTGNNRTNGVSSVYKLKDGTEIIPGQYEIRVPDSYIYFRSSAESGQNFLLADAKAAVERSRGREWQGMFFQDMVKVLNSDPRSFGIITARGQEAQDWEELLEYWKKEGFIPQLPQMNHIHNIALRSYDTLSLEADVRVQKFNLLKNAVQSLGLTEVSSETDMVLHPDGRTREAYHTVVFAEDDQQVIDFVFKHMAPVIRQKIAKVKFVLINTGTDRQVAESGRPRGLVITANGGFREARREEWSAEIEAQAKVFRAPRSCKVNLKGLQ